MNDRKVVIVARTPGTNWARVVFGTFVERNGDIVTLSNARQALYYSSDSRGEFGLAHIGPGKGSKLTPVASRAEIFGASLIVDCSPEAIIIWESAQ